MRKKIWVVIPYYRDSAALSRCVDKLNQSTVKDFEVFIRDNTNDNILYTAAVNEGIRAGMADAEVGYFMILNQDCYLESTALEILLSHLVKFNNCGIACPLQLQGDNDVTWGGSLEAFPLGRHFNIPIAEYKEPFPTYWANGACMMIRRSVIEEVGLLDKNLRFICSDADYSFTARSRGWDVYVVPTARAEHKISSSGKSTEYDINVIKVKDVIYFYEKWISGALYARISYEGPSLNISELENWVKGLRSDVEMASSIKSNVNY